MTSLAETQYTNNSYQPGAPSNTLPTASSASSKTALASTTSNNQPTQGHRRQSSEVRAGGGGPAYLRDGQMASKPKRVSQEVPRTVPHAVDTGIPPSSDDWKERGAATLVKSETDENGQVTTTVIKKGVKDFTFGRTLGEGSYSTVLMATDRQTLKDYAIKVLDKRHIIKEKKVKYVNIEKNTLNRLGDHPGVIRLYYTFQDEQSLYFVLDFASNGELLALIKRMGSLDEDCTRYYGAQLLDVIEFMHSKGVVHRDLKPENILLDEKMRIRVTDFGTAKCMDVLKDENGRSIGYPEDIRANSFVGTAEYVAPELLNEKATGKASDIWAFGCVLYQLIAGRPPFKAANEYQTFQKIVNLQFSYPRGFSTAVRDVVKRVLILNPRQRARIADIKQLQFFESVDWSDVKSIWKQPPPKLLPFKPESSRPAYSPAAARLGLPASVPPRINKPPVQQQPRAQNNQQRAINAAALAASKNAVTSATAAAVALKQQHNHQQQQVQQQPTPSARPVPQQRPSQTGMRPAVQSRKSSSNLLTTKANGNNDAPKPVRRASSSNELKQHVRRTSSSNQLRDVLEPEPEIDQLRQAPPPQPAEQPPPPPPPKTANTTTTPQFRQQPPPLQTRMSNSSQGGLTPSPHSATALNMLSAGSQTSSQPQQEHVPLADAPRPQQQQQQHLEIPPHSKLDSEWAGILKFEDERVLKVGSVQVLTTNYSQHRDDDDSDREPSKLSKFFSGPRRKKRRLLITTYARLLIVGPDDKKVRVELPLAVPQVAVREYQFNKKSNTGSFSVETHNKVYTIEDSTGSADWVETIARSKEYYASHQIALSSTAFATAAHAAAVATSQAPRESTPSYPAPPSSANATNASNGSYYQVDGTSSTFLARNEERKMKRRQ